MKKLLVPNRYFMFLLYSVLILINSFLIKGIPYYAYWDSALSYTTDSLLINGGLMPSHLFHPDVGVLWFEKFFVFPLAKALNIVSISTIQELNNSLNPYLNFVDVVNFLLIFRCSYVYVGCAVVYFALIKLFENIMTNVSVFQRILIFAGIMVFSFQGALMCNTNTENGPFLWNIRYEYGAVMWWSLAVLMMIYAIKTEKKYYIVAMGFFSGWAFISKIIVLPGIVLLPLIFCILHSFENEKSLECSLKEHTVSVMLSRTFLLITMLSILSIGIGFLTDSIYKSTFIGILKLIQLAVLMSIFPIFLGIQLFIAEFLKKNSARFSVMSFYFHRLVIFSSSLFIPMLIILFQKQGRHIFSNVYIFSFGLGQIAMSINSRYNNTAERIQNNGTMSILLAFILITLGLYCYYRIVKQKNSKLFCLSIALLGFSVLMNTLFLRGNEACCAFYNVFLVSSVLVYITYSSTFPAIVYKVIPVLLFLFVLVNVRVNRNEKRYVTNNYTYTIPPWYFFNYKGYALLYESSLQSIYKNYNNWEKVFYWSRSVYSVKSLLKSIQNSPNRLQDSTVLFENVMLSKRGETLIHTDRILQYGLSLSIDNRIVTIYPRVDYDFYLITSALIPEDMESLELTNLKFQTSENHQFFVYKFARSVEIGIINDDNITFSFNNEGRVSYLIIQDGLAQSFLNK